MNEVRFSCSIYFCTLNNQCQWLCGQFCCCYVVAILDSYCLREVMIVKLVNISCVRNRSTVIISMFSMWCFWLTLKNIKNYSNSELVRWSGYVSYEMAASAGKANGLQCTDLWDISKRQKKEEGGQWYSVCVLVHLSYYNKIPQTE